MSKLTCPHCQELITGPDNEIEYDGNEYEIECQFCCALLTATANVAVYYTLTVDKPGVIV